MTHQANTFIVGAPKSGTTALFHYLYQHPLVFTTTPKEPHYFATDLPGSRFVTDLQTYQNLFKNVQSHHKVLCEGSVLYLYSKEALSNIKSFNSKSKLIAMFRNPAELIHSFHSELIYGREESEESLEKAWELIPLRKQGQAIPKFNREPKLLFYDELAKHGEQLGRLLSLFPEHQVLIIFFDDFVSHTEAVYRKVLEFLDLPFFPADLKPINENKLHRNPRVADFVQRPPALLLRPYLQAKKLLGIENTYLGLRDPFLKANTLTTKRQRLNAGLQKTILDAYASDIEKLSKLTGYNLNHWFDI